KRWHGVAQALAQTDRRHRLRDQASREAQAKVNGPWTEFIKATADLSVLSDETLERAHLGLEVEAAEERRYLWMCSNCGIKDHCHGEVAWCMCACTEEAEG